jgi:hypothetical protein
VTQFTSESNISYYNQHFLHSFGILFCVSKRGGEREKVKVATKEHNFTIGGQTCHFHDESDKGVTGGHFHTYDEFRVSHEHAPRKIHVLIPINYLSHNQSKRYPVIYMNDGQTAFWNGGLANKSWNVSSYNNRLYQSNFDILRLDKHYLRYTRKIILNKRLLLPFIHLIAIENIRIHIGCGMFIFKRLS